jgi:hypothetical protein
LAARVLPAPPPHRDVGAGADEAREAAVQVPVRPAVIQDPAVLPVLPLLAVFQLERLAHLERRRVLRDAPLAVVGMDRLVPSVALLLIERPTDEHEPAAVEVGDRVVLVVATPASETRRRRVESRDLARIRPPRSRCESPSSGVLLGQLDGLVRQLVDFWKSSTNTSPSTGVIAVERLHDSPPRRRRSPSDAHVVVGRRAKMIGVGAAPLSKRRRIRPCRGTDVEQDDGEFASGGTSA